MGARPNVLRYGRVFWYTYDMKKIIFLILFFAVYFFIQTLLIRMGHTNFYYDRLRDILIILFVGILLYYNYLYIFKYKKNYYLHLLLFLKTIKYIENFNFRYANVNR